jgi:hypothetical protein
MYTVFIQVVCFRSNYLRKRKHFPCFYRVAETRESWEKREIPSFYFTSLSGTLGALKKCFHSNINFFKIPAQSTRNQRENLRVFKRLFHKFLIY